MADQPKDAGLIRYWHAHVYYDPERTRPQAAELRGWIEQRFPVRMGRKRVKPTLTRTGSVI